MKGLYSQNTIIVTQTCNLKCGFCPLWQPEKRPKIPFYHDYNHVNLIKRGLFFKVYPRAKLFNVVGGDPFCSSDLAYILTYLKSEGIKTRLWTNGLFPAEMWGRIEDQLDYVMIYVPCTERELYNDITGVDGWPELVQIIMYLKEKKVSLTLHYPVRVETVQYLPEIYDFSFENQLPLYIHFDKKINLEKESKRYINRFKKAPNVTVYKTDKENRVGCAAVPFHFQKTKKSSPFYCGDEWWPVLCDKYAIETQLKHRFG